MPGISGVCEGWALIWRDRIAVSVMSFSLRLDVAARGGFGFPCVRKPERPSCGRGTMVWICGSGASCDVDERRHADVDGGGRAALDLGEFSPAPGEAGLEPFG